MGAAGAQQRVPVCVCGNRLVSLMVRWLWRVCTKGVPSNCPSLHAQGATGRALTVSRSSKRVYVQGIGTQHGPRGDKGQPRPMASQGLTPS